MLAHGAGGVGPDAVAALHTALRRALDTGRGPGLLMARDASEYAASLDRITEPLDDVDVVIRTSGSTDGTGRLVGLSLAALTASARATLARLEGPGQWLTSLPVHAVAGFQVVLRSALAGIAPVVYAPASGFDGDLLAQRVGALRADVPSYLSLVPTQLHRALETAPALLARFSTVLVGGAALPSGLAARARGAGVRVVATYGMTETSGGCVYDGEPLDGVRVGVVDGRIRIAGPVLATRYLDTPAQPFVTTEGQRWLLTHDLGSWVGGRLRVRGRADDVIISGGVNVNPHEVEESLSALPGRWVVVGVPDDAWGSRVVAVTDGPASLADARAATAGLPPAGRPRGLVHLAELPLRPSGKVDRRQAARLAGARLAAGRGERR